MRVSPHKMRVSSREMRVSSRENHWSVYLGINYKQSACEKTINFSRCGKVYPTRASGFAGSCLTRCFKGANFNLQAKNFNESDEKQMSKMFAKTRVQQSLYLFHCNVLTLRKYEQQLLSGNLLHKTQYYHRKWRNWMETLFFILKSRCWWKCLSNWWVKCQ